MPSNLLLSCADANISILHYIMNVFFVLTRIFNCPHYVSGFGKIGGAVILP